MSLVYKGQVYPLEGMSAHLSIENARSFLSAGGSIAYVGNDTFVVYENTKHPLYEIKDGQRVKLPRPCPRGYIDRVEFERLKKLTPYLKNDTEKRKIRRTDDRMYNIGKTMNARNNQKNTMFKEERKEIEKAAKADAPAFKKPLKYFTLEHAARALKRGARFMQAKNGYYIVSTEGETLGFICVFQAKSVDKSKIADWAIPALV